MTIPRISLGVAAWQPVADNDRAFGVSRAPRTLPEVVTLDAFPTDPYNGGPYVMWKGTPYAPLMVPLGEKIR